MGLFSRGHASSPGAQHDAFWQWWDESGQRLTTGALARNDPMSVSDTISAAVETIHPELAWELAAGEISEHVLVVTAGGNPDLRAAARRWLLAAPPADEVWSYADFRPPAGDPESIRLSSGQAPDIDFGRVCVAPGCPAAASTPSCSIPCSPTSTRTPGRRWRSWPSTPRSASTTSSCGSVR